MVSAFGLVEQQHVHANEFANFLVVRFGEIQFAFVCIAQVEEIVKRRCAHAGALDLNVCRGDASRGGRFAFLAIDDAPEEGCCQQEPQTYILITLLQLRHNYMQKHCLFCNGCCEFGNGPAKATATSGDDFPVPAEAWTIRRSGCPSVNASEATM